MEIQITNEYLLDCGATSFGLEGKGHDVINITCAELDQECIHSELGSFDILILDRNVITSDVLFPFSDNDFAPEKLPLLRSLLAIQKHAIIMEH